ncbi:hypothetical protein K493DRAFT_310736 [Basidiobolus meristosporus CBS 931.73]|uniref:Uncharacterized protein n=1 Tax=Basidiobolus meristosporus CBS 931.73 TaxID=1314790 RepID=A0A1Y1Z761_9FUNG|nr:hypothetical protein K493DRAFT_310736 [Basidiobolus meristosporus CBS 931.73]|eukprot:ORY06100.1 hypothetical protein K493DRAFT_310736 [Basidiobolus meristosporus CBS 931.73]
MELGRSNSITSTDSKSSSKPNMSISFSKDVNWLKESCKLPRSPYPRSTLFGSIGGAASAAPKTDN